MKIVHVTLRFDAPGGVETTVRETCRSLRAAGDEVEVFASDLYDESRWQRRNDYRAEVDGVPVRRFPVVKRLVPGLTMPMMIGLVDALGVSGADVIHAHSHRYGHVLEAAAVSERTGIPLVVSTHYHPADRGEPAWKRGLLRLQDVGFGMTAYRVARRLVVESDLEAGYVREFAPADRIRKVPPGIDLSAWRGETPAPSARLRLPDGYVLFAGRIASNKGLEHLLEALARIPAPRRPPLVLMGRDWGAKAGLESLAVRLGVTNDLTWTGHVDDLAEYRAVIRGARALILPSEWEAYGLVLLDAMAARTPIVATGVGAVPEVLEGGRLGHLVPYGAPDRLGEAIEQVLGESQDAHARSDAAYAAVQQLDWTVSAGRLREIYRESLAG